MADLFTLFGTIAVNADAANRTIDTTTGKAGGLAKRFDSVGNSAVSLGKKIKSAIVTAGITKAITSLTKASIGAYANYEQLVGGVETLFGAGGLSLEEYAASVGQSVEKVQAKYDSLMSAQSAIFANANQAYKTAGLSANEYMETATSFAASLVSSLKGDTEEAARLTDMAVTDMADNANKMGTSIGSIQNAYQGFAKQNYAMLDNLKLGYGGTKKEMQRLLKDAQKISKQKYNIKNLDDIIEAIHVIQTEMGITGTTAMEASETIAGSWNATKSAWENLMIGLSDGGADIDELYANLESSAGNVVKNVAKVIPNLAKNVVKSVGNLMKSAGQKITDAWENTVYPAIRDKLQVSFGVNLPDWESLKTTITTKWAEVKAAFDEGGLSKAFNVLVPDWETLKTNIADGWTNTVWPGIQDFFKSTYEVVLPVWETLKTDISNGWTNTVWPGVQGLFSVAFGVEMPNWETVETQVSNWWNSGDSVYSKIKSVLKWTLGDFVAPSTETVVEKVQTWWTTTAQPSVTSVMQWTFGEIVLPSWIDFVGDVTTWWDTTCKPAIKAITTWEIGEIQLPSAEEVAQKIQTLWQGVMSLVNFYQEYDPTKTYTQEELNKGDKYGIDTTAGATTPVKLIPEEGSEGELQAEVAGYDLEGEALIEAEAASKGKIQGWLDKQNFTATVTLQPVMGAIPGFATGLERVPYDNMLAYLHKDEMVLTAAEAAVYRRERGVFDSDASTMRRTSASTDQPVTVNLTVNGVSSNPYEIAGEVRNALELLRWQG